VSDTWVLAIDFGTTFTSAAVKADGKVELIEIDGVTRMPSAVLWLDDEFVVGVAAENQRASHPDRLERTPKRHLGVRDRIILGGEPVSVIDAVAAVLRKVYDEALRRRDGQPPELVRLTHPARWGQDRIDALATAAAAAGISAPVFLAEPVAAALRYADVNIGDGDHVAVYDLGGGTFDTAILRRSGETFVLVGPPGGDERLGGEDFDHRLADYLRAQLAVADPDAALALATSTERAWRIAASELLTKARQAKEALSAHTSYTLYLTAPVDRELRVTRPEFEALVRDDLARTVDDLALAVERAGLEPNNLSAIYLTGGSSRIPLVSNLVHEAFSQVPNTWEDPKCVVALGAVRGDALQDDDTMPVAAVAARPGPAPNRRGRRLLIAAAVAAVLLIGATAAFALSDRDAPPDPKRATDPTTTSSVKATTSTPSSVAVSTTSVTGGTPVVPGGGGGGTGGSSGGSSSGGGVGGSGPTTPATQAPVAPANPTVPGVVGQSLNSAAATLKAAGFNNLPYVYDCYGSNSPGAVVSQTPGAGNRAPTSTAINLKVQANNCAFVPSVVGLQLSAAASKLQQAGFNDIPYTYGCHGSPNIGAVVSQSPSGGQVVVSTPIRLQLQANNC
jgi:actin-like ATPase involved in cell morphogenesis